MSKVKIQGNASGTGVLTVEAPNTNTDRTITLPDGTGTLLTTDGDGSSLTSLTSGNLTGALPAIDGSALTNLSNGSCAFSARAGGSTWSSISDGTILQFDNDSAGDNFDTDNCYSTSTYKFTAPATGVYMFWYAIYSGQNDTDNGFGFLKNSSKVDFQTAGSNFLSKHNSATDTIHTTTIILPLNINDTMAVVASITSDFYTGHSQWGGCRLK